ncbi:MAG: SDR family oxidoreductase [Chloroflexota bacterium]|nr:SDR family oxidoreductase [Chloroflexota bacterium]MDE2685605.1 SDR family oxidoreductase [Chloroflexota bacterium]
MQGKICLITGGSDGIGYAASRKLARMGARVVIVGRNAAKTKAAVRKIIADTDNPSVEYLLADLSSQREVRRVAAQAMDLLPHLDVLLNNAGAIFLSDRRSAEGIEMTFALNHLSYFLLTGLLLEHLRKAPRARIVNVSSCAHESPGKFLLEDLPKLSGNRGYGAYKLSKLCNILFTYELARRLKGENITANALHPGLVRTNIARNNGLLGRVVNFFIGVRGIGPDKGAETPVYLAASPEVEGVTGKYFVDCRPVPSSKISYDAELAARLWDMSASLTTDDDAPAR